MTTSLTTRMREYAETARLVAATGATVFVPADEIETWANVFDQTSSFVARDRRWMSSEQDHPEFGTVTHWSPRVGIPLPEDE